MRSPVIYSTTGAVLSSDEIAFAHHVAASFSHQTKPDYAKIIRRVDPTTGAAVDYHLASNIAYVTPGGAVDYVAVQMPNPVPYRGVSIGVTYDEAAAAYTTRMMASDATSLLELPVTLTGDGSATWVAAPVPVPLFDMIGIQRPNADWNGGGSLRVYQWVTATQTMTYVSSVVADIPEDCVYPAPPTDPVPRADKSPPDNAVYIGDDGYLAAWAAGVEAFSARRTAWFKRNSDETIAALKTGFAPGADGVTRAELQTGVIPAEFDFWVKSASVLNYSAVALSDGSYAGDHTRMPIVLGVTYGDEVISDTSANLSQEGTRVTQRETVFQYVDVDGVEHVETIVGTLTQTVTVRDPDSLATRSYEHVYLDWYTTSAPAGPYVQDETILTPRPFLRDSSQFALGTIWNGSDISGYAEPLFPDSKWHPPGNPLLYMNLTPPYPAYSNTMVGTAATLYLQYHNEIKPEYVKDTTLASTEMNNSALYGVTKIELSPVGCVTTESLGVFAHPDATANAATQIELYGTAVYDFDWAAGALTFSTWRPLLDADGNEVASKIVDLPAGETWGSLGTNCLITYRGLHWPDVKEYIKLRNRDMTSETFDFTTPGFKALVDAVKAG